MTVDKILIDRAVVEQALEALKQYSAFENEFVRDALRAALEQPQVEQEPVAHFYTRSGLIVSTEASEKLMQQMTGEPGRVALYAHPQPPRQPLTDQQIHDCFQHRHRDKATERRMITRAIERAHGIGGEA